MIITKLIAKPDTSGGGLIYDEHDNLTLSSNSLKVSPKNPFNDPNLYSIYKQENVREIITYTCKKNIEKDFTISSWVYITGAFMTYAFISTGHNLGADVNFCWQLVNTNGDGYSGIWSDRKWQILLNSIPLNKWVYITCINHNNNLTVYYDGKKQGSVNYNKSLEIDQGGNIFSINEDNVYERGIYGYIFDFFISDQAIWLKDFTPPIRPFDDDRSLYLDNDKNIWGCSKL